MLTIFEYFSTISLAATAIHASVSVWTDMKTQTTISRA